MLPPLCPLPPFICHAFYHLFAPVHTPCFLPSVPCCRSYALPFPLFFFRRSYAVLPTTCLFPPSCFLPSVPCPRLYAMRSSTCLSPPFICHAFPHLSLPSVHTPCFLPPVSCPRSDNMHYSSRYGFPLRSSDGIEEFIGFVGPDRIFLPALHFQFH